MTMKKLFALVLIGALCISTVSISAMGSDNLQTDSAKKFEQLKTEHRNRNINRMNALKKDKDFVVLESDVNGAGSFTNSPEVKNKDEFKAKVQEVCAQTTCTSSGSQSYSGGNISCYFNEDVTLQTGLFWGQNDSVNMTGGSSDCIWYGSNPYYPDTIDQEDIFTTTGTGDPSLSLGYVTGYATISYGEKSKGIKYNTLQATGKHYAYYHQGISCSASGIAITSYNRKTIASFGFGNTTVATQCDKTLYLY